MVDSLMATFRVDAGVIGAISGVYFYIYAPMQLPVGLLMDRYGPRNLLSIAAAICGLGAIIFGLAPDIGVLALGRFLIGFGSSFAFVGLLFITSHWFPRREMALLIGIANSVAMIGAVAGEGPISVIEDYLGWRYAMITFGIMGVLLALFIFLVIHNAPEGKEVKKHRQITLAAAWKNFKTVLAHPRSWLNATIAIFLYATTAVFAALWGVPFLMHNHQMDRDMAGFASSSLYIGWIVGGPVIGHLSDRLKVRRPFLKVCSLCGGITLLPVILFTNVPHILIIILLILVGIFSAAELLNFSYAIDQHSERSTGSAIAFTNFVIMLGGAIFQPMIGWILDLFWDGTFQDGIKLYSYNDYKLTMLCFPLFFFIAFTLSFFLKEKHL